MKLKNRKNNVLQASIVIKPIEIGQEVHYIAMFVFDDEVLTITHYGDTDSAESEPNATIQFDLTSHSATTKDVDGVRIDWVRCETFEDIDSAFAAVKLALEKNNE